MVDELRNTKQIEESQVGESRIASADFSRNDVSGGLAGAVADAWAMKTRTDDLIGRTAGETLVRKGENEKQAEGHKLDGKLVAADGDFAAGFPARGMMRETIADRLNDAMHEAANNAIRQVLQNPRWDREFNSAIRTADNNLAAHPQLPSELKEAKLNALLANARADGLSNAVDRMTGQLPKWEQRKIEALQSIKDGGQALDAYMKDKHPDIFKVMLKQREVIKEANSAGQHLEKLQGIKDGVTESRLQYADFLLRRNGKGDAAEAAALLAKVIKLNPAAGNLHERGELFHRVRDLAFQAGGPKNPDLVDMLKKVGIDTDTYFSPKLDRRFKFEGKQQVNEAVPMNFNKRLGR